MIGKRASRVDKQSEPFGIFDVVLYDLDFCILSKQSNQVPYPPQITEVLKHH